MQTVSVDLQAELDKGTTDPRILVDLVELYASDYVPGTDGFDPADALETFASIEITWNGIAYRRELAAGGGRGDIVRNMGEKTNSVTFNFSNVSRYMAALAQSQVLEGLFCVIRCVSPDVEDDSVVLFVGRCDKPSDIDKGSFTMSARQDFGNINQELPPRKFLAEDPEGRTPSDPLYEGFRLLSTSGSFVIPVTTPSTSFFGRLFGRTKTKNETRQYSSVDNTPFGSAVPMQFGLVQVELVNVYFIDEGYNLGGIWVIGEGRIDDAIVKVHNDYLQQVAINHYGDLGGTGSNADTDPRIGSPLSRTAYTQRSMYGSPGDTVEEAPLVTAIVRGIRIPIPNSDGEYDSSAWSNNGVNIARFVLTDPRMVNIDSGFMEDAVNYKTALHCDEPLIDYTSSQVIPIPNPDLPQAGEGFIRLRSSGILNPRGILYDYFGDDSIIPEFVDGPYEGFDPLDPPAVFVSQPLLRKRYTTNVPITDAIKAVDFLYKVVFPSFKGYLRVNKRGKYEIRSEQATDQSYLRASTAVGATSLTVQDVTPWKSGELLVGRLLLGFNQLTSEVRNITAAVYSADGNSITLTAGDTGGIVATASGANLSGGSTTVQASGTVTISGIPGPGDTVTVTINGVSVVYTLTAEDTTGTVAALLTQWINATSRLKPYTRAFWDVGTPDVVTIKCLYGALTLNSALLKTHAGPIADPTAAPTVAASSGGSLPAGVWKLAYSNANSIGSTALTPLASVTVTADQKIDVSGLPALPAGITARNFFLSDQAGSTNLKFSVQRTDAADFSITDFPEGTAAVPPSFNTTGEELMRVAMSFATNSQDVYPAWSVSKPVLLGETHLPAVLNGHKYAPTAGTTGATEPTWPTAAGGTVVDGGVTWTEAGSTVLQQAGLTRANIVKDSYKWPKGSTQSSVNQSKGEYIDTTNDFAKTPIRVNDKVHQLQVKKIYPHEINLAAVDNLHQALRLLNADLAKHREGDWFNSLSTGPNGLLLEEGDVICASDDSGGLINVVTRIEELRIKPNHNVEINQARKYSTNMFSDDVGAQTISLPSTLRLSVTADSIVVFIDNFPIRDADGLTPGFYVAVSRDLSIEGDWRGWALYADYGDGYELIAEGDLPAIMGEASTTLGTVADPEVFDSINTFTANAGTDVLTEVGTVLANGNSVQVSNSGGALPAPLVAGTTYFVRDKTGDTFKLAATSGGAAIDITTNGTGTNSIKNVLTFTLKYGPPSPFPNPFSTVTEADLIANPRKNLFHYGREYLQAATVVDNGNQSYTISDLYRGRFGTDGPELIHGADEQIVYLDGREVFVPIDYSRVDQEFDYKVVTTNQNVADATAVPFTWTGGTVRGLRPFDPIVSGDATGDYLVQCRVTVHPLDSGTVIAEFWVDEDRDDPDNDLKLSLPMVTGTTQAALMASTGGNWTEAGGAGEINVTSHAYKNNVANIGVGAVIGTVGGTTLQAIERGFQRFDFEMTVDYGPNTSLPYDAAFGAGFVVALETRADPSPSYITLDAADCPVSVEWSIPDDYYDDYPEGTVREVWRTYDTVILTREGIDPGRNPFTVVDNEIVNIEESRPGRRYTFLVNGNEIAAYRDFKPAGGNVPIVKFALGDAMPFPLRLSTLLPFKLLVAGSTCYLRGVMYGGHLGPSTIFSVRDQIAAFGSQQSPPLYIRLYQESRYEGIHGAPLDFVVTS